MLKKIIINLILISTLSSNAFCGVLPVYYSVDSKRWADSVLTQMTYEEKIGQLFMVAAYSNRDSLHVKYISSLIDSLHIGGLIFFQGGPLRQANLCNYYQSISHLPLMIGIDGEWGLSMRLDSTIRFPRQMTLGAGADDSLIYKMGVEIGNECKRMGIHLNFAPVIDINNNPLNPVINSRSFGSDKFAVARFAGLYMKGMQDRMVLACGKHFPGHGNTDTDSHFSLPVIKETLDEIDSVELYPFRSLINNGLASVMVAHLQIPALDSTGVPGTLSKPIISGLLKNKLGFNGLIFTDALDMKSVADNYSSGDLELKALLAGNDVLLNTENVYAAVKRIHYAIQNCEIDQEAIDEHVRKILMSKYWCGLNNYQPIDTTNLIADLKTEDAQWLNYRLYEKSLTLLKNDNIIPVKPFEIKTIASVVINDVKNNLFQQTLNTYAKVDCYSLASNATDNDLKELKITLGTYDLVIVSVHNTSTNASKNFNITPQMQDLVNTLSTQKNAVACLFGNAYTITKFDELSKYKAVIMGYEDTGLPQYFAAQTIFGGNSFSGKLPVSVNENWKIGNGDSLFNAETFKLTLPQEVTEDLDKMHQIDSLIYNSIQDSVFPGCQLLAARDGKIFYNKAFGSPVYNDSVKVKITDLYDIASVTKIASTALAAMYLYEHHKLDLNAKASRYLPELKKSNKAQIRIKDMMAHQAGLKAWIPFYKNTVINNKLSDSIYSRTYDENHAIEVADSVWMLNSYKDEIWKEILESPVEPPGHYIYSDLGLIILQHIIEKIVKEPIDVFVKEKFYDPLGIWRITFNPLKHFAANEIIPTEMDTVFRMQLIHGYVHDPAAAMNGGVAGHAGLFSNAQSLSVIMQMLLNGGVYDGHRYFKKETVSLFTNQAFPGTTNRRGLFFDKPEPGGKSSPAAESASVFAFGHAGFTGTCAWADPVKRIIYIFLSNRVYPSAENTKLAKRNVRTDIMELFYKAVE
jgi:beta-N-acetylhexosaminidase